MLHLINYYGFSGANSETKEDGAFENNEGAFSAIFEHTRKFGQIPLLLGCDANIVMGSSHQLQIGLQSGFHDVVSDMQVSKEAFLLNT